MVPETSISPPERPGQIATKPDPTHPAPFMPHDTHGPVYEQMFDFTGPRTGRPSSAPDRQQRPRKREQAQHGTPDASRPSGRGTGPGSAPGKAAQAPRKIRPRSAAGTQDTETGPSSAQEREKRQHAQPRPESPRTRETPERLTAGQDAPRNGPRTGGQGHKAQADTVILYV